MKHELFVLMNGLEVGRVVQDGHGRLSFTYADEWRAELEPTALSVSMPLATARHDDDVVRFFLWGLLPDNEAVLERWAREYGVSPRNPFALISHVGEDCAGAAQFVRPDRVGQLPADDDLVLLDERDIANRLRDLERDPTAWHGRLATGQFSLAGAQPKFALSKVDGEWAETRGAAPTTHIFKRAASDFRDLEMNEHICITLARRLGMPAAITSIMTFEDQRAIVSERYDRRRTNEGWERIHQEDLCQAFGRHPERKYQSDGGPSPAEVAGLLRSLLPADEADPSVARFADALALNWIIGGTDAHAKNYSLLLSGSQVRLAPLYDVASVLPYDLDRYRVSFAMKLGHHYRLKDITARDWSYLARDLGIDPDQMVSRILELCEVIPYLLEEICVRPDVVVLGSDMPKRLLDEVTQRSEECARMWSL